MVMKLYGHTLSAATACVRACLEEKGIEYKQITVDLVTGENKKPPHIFRNPFGQVPALEEGDLMLFESRAISRYIARKYESVGTDLLRSNNIREAAIVNVWMEVEATQFNPLIAPTIFHSLIMPFLGMAPDQKVIESNAAKLDELLKVYEAQLIKTEYLAGDFFSLADLNHLPSIHYLFATTYGSLIESRPHVKAWWERISSRPACKKVISPMSFPK